MDGNYYEDDVVKYTQSGKHPILPEKYKSHKFYWNAHKHILKGFFNKEQARISLQFARDHHKPMSDYTIFYCTKCCMYHITSNDNYIKYVNKYGK